MSNRQSTHTDQQRPHVLFYVQYLLGIGHIRRSALIAQALEQRGFEVHMLFGGIPVGQISFAPATMHYLSPIKTADENFSRLVHPDGSDFTDADKAARTQHLLTAAEHIQPDIILTETFPMGRRQMRFELVPLLDWAQQQKFPPLIVSSIRDILQRRKEKRERESLQWVEQYYDHLLVHGDQNFTPLVESFPPAAAVQHKLAYTGYVCPAALSRPENPNGIIVSVGGGSIGGQLLDTALAVFDRGFYHEHPWTLLTGPNMPAAHKERLLATQREGLEVMSMATDFVPRLAKARLSVSLGGYNTTMDILQTGVPSVMMPYEGVEETEQLQRAEKLAAHGRVQLVREAELSPDTLQAAMEKALDAAPATGAGAMGDIAISGARQSAEYLWQWHQARVL